MLDMHHTFILLLHFVDVVPSIKLYYYLKKKNSEIAFNNYYLKKNHLLFINIINIFINVSQKNAENIFQKIFYAKTNGALNLK
jgi:hypothetical protein